MLKAAVSLLLCKEALEKYEAYAAYFKVQLEVSPKGEKYEVRAVYRDEAEFQQKVPLMAAGTVGILHEQISHYHY